MIWAKQRVSHAACMIYMETIGALQFEDPSSVGELMMVGRDVDGRHQDVYISVPSRELLARFDGFEAVSETQQDRNYERSRGIWTNLFGGSKKNSEENSEK